MQWYVLTITLGTKRVLLLHSVPYCIRKMGWAEDAWIDLQPGPTKQGRPVVPYTVGIYKPFLTLLPQFQLSSAPSSVVLAEKKRKEKRRKEKKTMAEPSSAPAKSDAEIEEILDRMLTRLALCDDPKLEALLSKLLPYSIASLSSQSLAVRKKVCSPPLSSVWFLKKQRKRKGNETNGKSLKFENFDCWCNHEGKLIMNCNKRADKKNEKRLYKKYSLSLVR